MLYKGAPQHGTKIIQLLVSIPQPFLLTYPRKLLLSQDLFENIMAFNRNLLFTRGAPSSSQQSTKRRSISRHPIRCVSLTP